MLRRFWLEVFDEMAEKKKGLKKNPGFSWVEGNKGKELKAHGYQPKLSSVPYDVADEEKKRILMTHSEKLALAFGVLTTSAGCIIRIMKNMRICEDCHVLCVVHLKSQGVRLLKSSEARSLNSNETNFGNLVCTAEHLSWSILCWVFCRICCRRVSSKLSLASLKFMSVEGGDIHSRSKSNGMQLFDLSVKSFAIMHGKYFLVSISVLSPMSFQYRKLLLLFGANITLIEEHKDVKAFYF
ncbi:hypothetical protein Patl1_07898 [Pistacia atlantica]|uniref:Uncharacterized protein n=1 Tax=Pistacia atlantica TaxID=434234 RepID=A0ACC1AGZ4_9ROSI|nr:hypothetical protein Patl1_07898 [Pistacia atlantica]